MEKFISKKTIIKTIEEVVELEQYRAKDGTIFDTEEGALKYEEESDFMSYFRSKYKVKTINSFEYGLNYGNCVYCHLVFIKKLNDKNIDDLVRFYELEDHPDDIMKFVEGWSFIALISDVNLWVFDQTDRKFIVQSLQDAIQIKKNELEILTNLV